MDWLCLEITPEVSFGMFYKPYPGDDVLRKFISLIRQHISASREAKHDHTKKASSRSRKESTGWSDRVSV